MKISLKICCVVLFFFVFLLGTRAKEYAIKEASLGDFPSVVALVFIGIGHLCGGVLISSAHVTLAGHCVKTGESILRVYGRIIAGDVVWNGTSPSRQEKVISKVLLHPQFNCKTYENDIAVVTVSEPFLRTEYVQLRPISDAKPELGSLCYAPNWQWKPAKRSLHYIAIRIVRDETCAHHVSEVHQKAKTICVSFPTDRLNCEQQTGGPLICRNSLQGLHTGGNSSCNLSQGGLKYTAVSAFRDFLHDAVSYKKKIILVSGMPRRSLAMSLCAGIIFLASFRLQAIWNP